MREEGKAFVETALESQSGLLSLVVGRLARPRICSVVYLCSD